jgi:hypothetical protein
MRWGQNFKCLIELKQWSRVFSELSRVLYWQDLISLRIGVSWDSRDALKWRFSWGALGTYFYAVLSLTTGTCALQDP